MTERLAVYLDPNVVPLPVMVIHTAQKAVSVEHKGMLLTAYTAARDQYLNRGRTAGSVFVYWLSYDHIDSGGYYYPYTSPAWGDIVEVVGISRIPAPT